MYFDIQVNGYAGIDFNQNTLSLEDFAFACEKLKADGVSGILATLITADFADMLIRIRNIVHFRNESQIVAEMVKGIHLEGPFISAEDGYRGAHPKKHVLKASLRKMCLLLEACEGLLKIVTLAPENDSECKVIKYLHDNKVVISAGHCNPSLEQLNAAIKAGLSMFTHLGNGCPQQMHRHDNIIQRVLSLKDDLWLCFIADGHHIPFWALKNYIALVGTEKVIITTDAMAAAGAKEGVYTLGEIQLEVSEDRVVREPGKPNFAGSAIDMKSSEMNLAIELGLTPSQLYQILCANPLKALNA
ncbi:MAG: hypothetical protein AAGC78_07310 [Cellvibrio sp.]|uniref:N-acetylglucosamine-6-phosphate deacetylase n=1 Tax=Cellvibrio sp. TaxID=1965322 RepID=UPI0031B5319B